MSAPISQLPRCFPVISLVYYPERAEAVVALRAVPGAAQAIRLDGPEVEVPLASTGGSTPQYVLIKNVRRGFFKTKITGAVEVVCGAKGDPPHGYHFIVEPGRCHDFTCMGPVPSRHSDSSNPT